MDRPNLEIEAVSLVLLGDFNPAVFRPMWFSGNGLVRDEEAAAATSDDGVVIVTPATAFFSMGWLSVHAMRERLNLSTLDAAQFSTLRDVASGMMSLLSHTPVRALGINYDCHYGLEDDVWSSGGGVIDLDEWGDVLDSPILQTLALQGARPGGGAGSIRVKVESSKTVRGIYVQVNEHVVPPQDSEDLGWLFSCLNEEWDAILERSRQAVDETLKRTRL